MGKYKELVNALTKSDPYAYELSETEMEQLRKTLNEAFLDLQACCREHGLTVMMGGGSALGAIRHEGYIPWDDDMDVLMPRADFDKLKEVFEDELGDKYVLSSPNYKGNAKTRFPMMLIKGTLLVESDNDYDDESANIKIDIFVIENVPKNALLRIIKGIWVTILMFMGSYEDTYEHRSAETERFMSKTEEGRREYRRRLSLGRLFSFFSFQKWMDIIDRASQYGKNTGLMGIPSGRAHYFGEILPITTFLPPSKGMFDGMEVDLPGDAHDYLRNLYGEDYMSLPPEEKRERHFIKEIRFKTD